MSKDDRKMYIKLPSKIITKLGGTLYGGFVPAICETISNSYDADATLVTIRVTGDEVCIEDNGVGMDWETLKNSFFEAGKNRRNSKNHGKTAKGRFVTGKKGLGKFALFGFCKELYIETSDGKNINTFVINIDDLNKFNDTQYPLESKSRVSIDGKSYTKITLRNLLKKYKGLESLDSLARRINYVFQNDNDEFLVKLITRSGVVEQVEQLDQEKRRAIVRGDKDDDQRIIYEIPESLSIKDEANTIKLDERDIEFINKNGIKGFLVARKNTTKEAEQKGVAIFCRGKICQDPSYFDIQQTNSYGYAHLYGELEMDFLDKEDDKDYISTNRKEIEWDKDEVTEDLRRLINKILKGYGIAYDRDKKRLEEKELEEKSEQLGIDIQWYNKYKLDQQTKELFKAETNRMLTQKNSKKGGVGDEQKRRYVKFLQNLARQIAFLNDSYLEKNVLLRYPQIKELYDQALVALATGDLETTIIKSSAILDGIRTSFPHIGKIFEKAIEQYANHFQKQEVHDSIKSLLNPLKSFARDKNPIEKLRSSTQTAHNTSKNPQALDNKYLVELVLNYIFMYAGFVLGNPELFSQSPDSLEEGQHSQSDEQ